MTKGAFLREIFRLSDGVTVLACECFPESEGLIGRHASIVVDGHVRQGIIITGERTMRDQTLQLDQRAFETHDRVEVTPEEVRGGTCRLAFP